MQYLKIFSEVNEFIDYVSDNLVIKRRRDNYIDIIVKKVCKWCIGIIKLLSMVEDINNVEISESCFVDEVLEVLNGVSIRGNLVIRKCEVKRIKVGVRVGGNLIVKKCGLLEEIDFGGNECNGLICIMCNSLRVVRGIVGVVSGDIVFKWCNNLEIVDIKGGEVRGNYICVVTGIKEGCSGVSKVGGNLEFRDCNLMEIISDDLRYVGKDMVMMYCRGISKLDKVGLVVGGDVVIRGCIELIDVRKFLVEVRGNVYLYDGTDIEYISNEFLMGVGGKVYISNMNYVIDNNDVSEYYLGKICRYGGYV